MIFTKVIPCNDISDSSQLYTEPSRPSGFRCIDDMFDGNGYPSSRNIHVYSESTQGSILLIMKTMMECLQKGLNVTIINTNNNITKSIIKQFLSNLNISSSDDEYEMMLSKCKLLHFYDIWSVLTYFDNRQKQQKIDNVDNERGPKQMEHLLILDDLNHLFLPLLDETVNADSLISSLFLHFKYLNSTYLTTVVSFTNIDSGVCGTISSSSYNRSYGKYVITNPSTPQTSSNAHYVSTSSSTIPLHIFNEVIDISLLLKSIPRFSKSVGSNTDQNESLINLTNDSSSIYNVNTIPHYSVEVKRRPPFYVNKPVSGIIS